MSVPNPTAGPNNKGMPPIDPSSLGEREHSLLNQVEALTTQLRDNPLPGGVVLPELEESIEPGNIEPGNLGEDLIGGAINTLQENNLYTEKDYHLVSWAERGKEMVSSPGKGEFNYLMKRLLSAIDSSVRNLYQIGPEIHLTFHFYLQSISYVKDGVEHTIDLHQLHQRHKSQNTSSDQAMSLVLDTFFQICRKAYPKSDLPVSENGGKGAPDDLTQVKPLSLSPNSHSPFAPGGACFLGGGFFGDQMTKKDAEIIRDLLKSVPPERREDAIRGLLSYSLMMKTLAEKKETLQDSIQHLVEQPSLNSENLVIKQRVTNMIRFLDMFLSKDANHLPMLIDMMVGGHKETTAELENAKAALELGTNLYKQRVGSMPMTTEDKNFLIDIGGVATQTSSGYELYMRYLQGQPRKSVASIESLEAFARRVFLQQKIFLEDMVEEDDSELPDLPSFAVVPGLFSLWEGFGEEMHVAEEKQWTEAIALELVTKANVEDKVVNNILSEAFFSSASDNAPPSAESAESALTAIQASVEGFLFAPDVNVDDDEEADDEESLGLDSLFGGDN